MNFEFSGNTEETHCLLCLKPIIESNKDHPLYRLENNQLRAADRRSTMNWEPIETAPKELVTIIQADVTGPYYSVVLRGERVLLTDEKQVWEDCWEFVVDEDGDFTGNWRNYEMESQSTKPLFNKPTRWAYLPAPPEQGGEK